MANEKNLKPFQKGKSGNPNGRPKKTINVMLQQFKDSSLEIPTANQIKEIYLAIAIMTQDELKKTIQDKDCPMIIRICATNILSKKGFDIVEKMLDRAIGKATQKTEITGEDGNAIDFTINVIQGNKILPYDLD